MVLEVRGSTAALGNIWLHRLLRRSSEARSPLLMGVLKRGEAAEEPWDTQFEDGSVSLTGRGGAAELGSKGCV